MQKLSRWRSTLISWRMGYRAILIFCLFNLRGKHVRVVELEKRRWRKINLRAPVGIQWLDESLNWLIWRRLFLWEIRLICCGVSRDLNSWNLDMVLFYVLLLVYYLLLLLLFFFKKINCAWLDDSVTFDERNVWCNL
jgi:hypothetical protein